MSNYQIAQCNAAAYTKNFAKYETPQWKMLFTSDDTHKSVSGFYGVVYVGRDSKEVLIANSGTNFDIFNYKWIQKLDFSVPVGFVQDIISDIQIYFGYTPNQFTYAATHFIDDVISALGEEAHNYKFITTGHSLGAVLSNLENAKLTALGYQASSINIDSPGSKPVVEHYLHTQELQNITVDDLDITTYNTQSHFINSLHQELGQIYEFDMPYSGISNHHFGNIMRHGFDKEGDFMNCHLIPDYTNDMSMIAI